MLYEKEKCPASLDETLLIETFPARTEGERSDRITERDWRADAS